MGYVGRFAPSPTGPLHLGSLVAALGSFLDARHERGRWLLRIEDLDTARVRPGCADEIKRTLENLGLHWDGPVEYQSRRRELYAQALQALQRQALLYACHCTRRELADSEAPGYPGTCRNRRVTPGPAALRFRVDEGETVDFIDRFQGPSRFAMELHSAMSSSAGATRLSPISWRWWWTMRTRASPTSCAARTSCRARPGSFSCSGLWGYRPPVTAICP